MNKKIKVIDLIDMKYHNLELPKNIIINRMRYYYDIGIGTYYDENEEKMTLDFTNNVLNMDVEILEDNTEEIEEYKEEIEEYKLENFEQLGYEVGKLYLDFAKGIAKAINSIRKEKNND